MNRPRGTIYKFADFVLAPDERLLLRAGEPVRLTGRAFDLLVVLVRHHGHLVGKDQLLHAVWRGQIVEEVNLSVHISTLRRVLGCNAGGGPIQTVSKSGYRFVAAVNTEEPWQAPPGARQLRPKSRNADAERSHWLVWLRLDPRWDALRGERRFAELVGRVRFPP